MKISKITLDTNLLIKLFDLKIQPKTIPSNGSCNFKSLKNKEKTQGNKKSLGK